MFVRDFTGLFVQAPAAACRALTSRRGLVLLKHRDALGDKLMLTPLARALRQHVPGLRVTVAAPDPAVFLHNPHFDEVRAWHLWRTRRTFVPQYSYLEPRDPNFVRQMWLGLWDFLAARGWVTGPCPALADTHPEVFLTEAERARGRERIARGSGRPVVALISGGKTQPTHNREWGYANFLALARALGPHADLLQVAGERPLELAPGRPVRDLRVGVREVAAVLAACDAFVTQEGGLMHLARAVEAPTVVLFGGGIEPERSGYDRMTNLFCPQECGPCLPRKEDCPHLACMASLTPRVVLGEVGKLLQARGFTLPETALAAAPDAWTPPEFVDRALLAAELAKKVPVGPRPKAGP